MKKIRAGLFGLAVLASLAAHAGAGIAVFAFQGGSALDAGPGEDVFLAQHSIAIESLGGLGEAFETTTASEAAPKERSVAQAAVEEIKKPDETPPPITSKGPETDHAVEAVPPTPERPRPQQVAAIEQTEQLPTVNQQSGSVARNGGDTTRFNKYLGSVRQALERAKINPGTRKRGTVVLKFTLLPTGQVLEREIATSSGSKVLDDAAVAALDKAAPDFPPFPDGIGREPRNVTVPFEYIVR